MAVVHALRPFGGPQSVRAYPSFLNAFDGQIISLAHLRILIADEGAVFLAVVDLPVGLVADSVVIRSRESTKGLPILSEYSFAAAVNLSQVFDHCGNLFRIRWQTCLFEEVDAIVSNGRTDIRRQPDWKEPSGEDACAHFQSRYKSSNICTPRSFKLSKLSLCSDETLHKTNLPLEDIRCSRIS